MSLEKIADAISQLRRMAMKKNPDRFKHLGHQARTDAVRHEIAKGKKLLNEKGTFGEKPVHSFKETEGHNYVFRGEADPGKGSFIKDQGKNPGDKAFKFREFKPVSKDKRFWSRLPQAAMMYMKGGKSPRLLAQKVSEESKLFPRELSNKRTDTAKDQLKRIKIRKNQLESQRDMNIGRKQFKQFKNNKTDISAYDTSVNGVKIKDLNEWKKKHISKDRHNVSAGEEFQPNELVINKNKQGEILKLQKLRNERSFYKTNDGTTVATKGLRKTDMFRPSN